MQQIERFGVIALVFLLITIVAVSFWGDSKSPGFWSRLTGRAKQEPTPDHVLPPGNSTDTALTPPAPLDLDPQRKLVADGGSGAVQTAPSSDSMDIRPLGAPAGDKLVQQPATPPVASNPAPAASSGEYVVQKGDSLALIARRTLGKESRWTEIAALNPGLTPKSLKVGAKLNMPTDASAAPKAPAAATPVPVPVAAATPKAKPKASEPAPKSKPKPEVASLLPSDDKPRVR